MVVWVLEESASLEVTKAAVKTPSRSMAAGTAAPARGVEKMDRLMAAEMSRRPQLTGAWMGAAESGPEAAGCRQNKAT